MRVLRAVVLALVLVPASAAPAGAAITAQTSGTAMVVTGDDGDNNLTFYSATGGASVASAAGGLTPPARCRGGATFLTAPGTAHVEASLGGGADRAGGSPFSPPSLPLTLDGGPGADTLGGG